MMILKNHTMIHHHIMAALLKKIKIEKIYIKKSYLI